MRIRVGLWAVFALSVALPLASQEVPPSLTLQRALDLARINSPTYLQTENDQIQATWDVRQAYGQLLPTASANSGVTWQGSGETQLSGGLTTTDLGFGDLPSYYQSNYGVSLGLNLSWSSFLAPNQAKANQNATGARIRVAEANLISLVTNSYLDVLRQHEGLRLAQQQLENNQFNLRLAQGQLEVGVATPIDVGQAEVLVGRAEVTVLQQRNAITTARLRLFQSMGVALDQDAELATTFQLSEPPWELEDLLDRAIAGNPALASLRSSRRSAEIGVSAAKGAYFPSFSVSTGWSGYTREASTIDYQVAQVQGQVAAQVAQCAATNDLYSRLADPLPPRDCTQYAFTDAQRQAMIDANDQFPFSFDKAPLTFRFNLSIPIFQGLTRQRNLEAAKLQRDDLNYQLREQEIALRADLAVALATSQTAYQSALLEGRNKQLAEQQLRLARERYQLGAITFVELVSAQTVLAQADRDEIGAIFAYHDSVTRLETLVGTSLR